MENNTQAESKWMCPACGFETTNEEEKVNHIQSMEGDPAHMNMEDIETTNENAFDDFDIDMLKSSSFF